MGISGSYFIDIPELNSIPSGAQLLGGKDNILFRADPSLLGGTTVVDALNSTSATDALSANQGKALDGRLQTVENAQASYGDIVTYDASAFDSAGSADAAESNAKAYADTLVVGLLDDRGNYDPTGISAYPTTGGSGVDGAILKGDLWAISADGTINGIAVTIGDTIRALVNAPAQVNANWAIIQNNLIYAPENINNKATSLTLPDDTKYPTTKAVATALSGYLTTINAASTYATKAGQRYQFLNDSTTTLTTYTVPNSAVTENGQTIIELSNNGLTSITINAATGTGKVAGDSVNISITGTYTAQVLAAGAGVTLQGDLTFSYQHQTKTLVYKGSNVWKVVG